MSPAMTGCCLAGDASTHSSRLRLLLLRVGLFSAGNWLTWNISLHHIWSKCSSSVLGPQWSEGKRAARDSIWQLVRTDDLDDPLLRPYMVRPFAQTDTDRIFLVLIRHILTNFYHKCIICTAKSPRSADSL